tara:strand:- start:173 stop:292 length:120 start_codon:yes stop_codon:yes gene_type:complete
MGAFDFLKSVWTPSEFNEIKNNFKKIDDAPHRFNLKIPL